MSVELVIPSMGESVTTAIISKWLKKPGDPVRADESVVSVDSDKATAELPSPVTGVIEALLVAEGDEVTIGQAIARIAPGEAPVAAPREATAPTAAAPPGPAGPAVRQALRDAGVGAADVHGSGKGGRITRQDVASTAHPSPSPAPSTASPPAPTPRAPVGDEPVEIVPMTNLRRRIAERLVEAQSTAAILTTFNEIDMSAVMALRERYQERFAKKYGIKIGFMSFFVKAAIEALKAFPMANAEIRGTDIVYKHFYHVGVAVSGPRGLVVPVVRHADRLSFAETEQAIAAYGQKARDGQITVDDLQGGTFTISNGGTFGSMMSTPILNSPQVAILGMHAITKRAVVVSGPEGDQVVIRPMMYVAMSYDHRLLDGREAVLALVRIKECVENPERILLEI